METIRAFIAVDIGDDIRTRLESFQRRLKQRTAHVRWVKPSNIHLTLAFLGETSVDELAALQPALDAAVQETPPFTINAVGGGYFGRPGRPRVLWAGLADCEPLTALHLKICEVLNAAGVEYDRKPYSPHLTLGRFRGSGHAASLLEEVDKSRHLELGSAAVHGVALIRSDLGPDGAVYTVLHTAPLS